MTISPGARRAAEALRIKVEYRPVYVIDGDYKRWRYLTAHAALKRLAWRRLLKKFPIEVYEGDERLGMGREYESDLDFEKRREIVNRFARRYRKALKMRARRLLAEVRR